MKKTILLLLASMVLIVCGYEYFDSKKHFEKSLQENLNLLVEQYHVPGAVLLIQSPQYNGIFTVGKTDLKTGKPITADTLFGIGSITKTIISAMILKLEAEGKLNIYNPIGEYFPQYPRWQDVTIEQLLNMTSGIFNYMNDEKYKNDLNANFKRDWNTDQLINLAYQHADDFKSGTNWSYTNTGYLLLGKIIAQVTGQSVCEALTAYSGDKNCNLSLHENLALGYYNGTLMEPRLLTNIGFASGGMAMSVNDLSIFLNHLFIQQDILPAKQLNEMIKAAPHSAGKMRPPKAQFALGLGIFEDDKLGKILSYTAVIPTGTAMYLWIPQRHTLIITFSSLDRHGDKDYDILFLDKPFVKNILALLFPSATNNDKGVEAVQ